MFSVACLKFWISVNVFVTMGGAGEEATANGDASEQRFAIEPQDQTAIVGSRVTLPCRVINKLGSLQWTRDDFALGTHRSLSEFFRYAMIGSDEEGDFSLAIEPVTLDDDATYQCQVSSGPNGENGIRSRYARLTVLVPPEKPRIIQGASLETTEDSDVKLECISHGGKPAAEITWIDGFGNVVKKRSPSVRLEYSAEQIPESRLFVAKSVLTIRPKKEHHNTTFICHAQNTADRTYQSAKIILYVKYAPKVSLLIVPDNRVLVEGSPARLLCRTDANPPDVTYRWFLNQQQVFPEFPMEYVIPNVSRNHHDMIVKCEARNLIGKSEDSQTLDVTYGPRFRQRPQSVQTDADTTIHLTCEVDSNPIAEITWTDGREQIVGRTTNLTVIVSRETAGKYSCRAHVPKFADITSDAYVGMNGRPTIQKDSVQYGLVGETIRLDCWAYSVPSPVKTSWSFNGQLIGPDHRDYSIREYHLPDGIRSTLLIRDTRQEHYGTYNCSVTNQYGTDVADILLKPQRNFPLSTVLTAALMCGVILITLLMVVIMCQRRRRKPAEMEVSHVEKQCKESDKSSIISELKLEIRSGSSMSNINSESDYGGAHDSDSIITRVAVPLAGPVPIEKRYSTNHFSTGDGIDSMFETEGGQNNNGYVPYVEYSRDYSTIPQTCSLSNGISPLVTSCDLQTAPSLDLRYSAVYGNPYLTTNHNNALPTLSNLSQPLTLPQPPPYTTSRETYCEVLKNLRDAI